jgi:hypothetical protein
MLTMIPGGVQDLKHDHRRAFDAEENLVRKLLGEMAADPR